MTLQRPPPLRTAIFHREALSRRTLTTLLEEGGFKVTAAASPVEGQRPQDLDLAVFDAGFLRHDLSLLRRWCGGTRSVILTDQFSLADFRTAARLGAAGYLASDSIAPDALILSLRLAEAGEFVFPAQFGSIVTGGSAPPGGGRSPPDGNGDGVLGYSGLYRRDLWILRLVVQGRSNKEIAQALGASEDVVKMRLSEIMRLVRARNRIQAAVWAVRQGLIDPADHGRQGGGA